MAALKPLGLDRQVEVVEDGEEALEFMQRRGRYADRAPGNPAVILLDLKMPKVDGLELLREVKADDEMGSTPVVVMTSSTEQSDVEESDRLNRPWPGPVPDARRTAGWPSSANHRS